jgi:cytochrome d ubiquinol oxidase subunit II
MMLITPENIAALVIVFALIIYVLTGGADFGGGVWDLFARGKRAHAQRELIANVLAPIWEANHIWLILMIVLLFVIFPKAYSTILTFLHFPTSVMLFGIVLRGSAFVFRKYDEDGDKYRHIWSLCFAIGSIITPFFLGDILGAITIEQRSLNELLWSWIHPFPIFCGFLTLAICAYLAAVYLCSETHNADLQDDFRLRAFISGLVLLALTFGGTVIAYFESINLFYELVEGIFSIPLQSITIGSALLVLWFLYKKKFFWARIFAMLQVVALLFGWMITQYPDLITGHLSIADAAAPQNVIIITLAILGVGILFLAPSLIYLYVIFFGKYR